MKESFHKYGSEQAVAIMNLQETVAELRERNAKLHSDNKAKDARIKELYDNLERLSSVNHEPAQMTTPLGMLPIDSRGMRRLADAYAQIAALPSSLPLSRRTPRSRKRTMPMKRSSVCWQRLFVSTTLR